MNDYDERNSVDSILKNVGYEAPEAAVEQLSDKIGAMLDKRELVKLVIDKQPMFYDKARLWWLWNDNQKKWERTDETDILNAIDDNSLVNTINSKEKYEILEALKQVSRKNAPKDIKPTWIQFNDTIVDVETGDQFPTTAEYFVTNPIPWSLSEDGDMETPVMDKIFEDWVGEDFVQTLKEIIAYSMIPDYPIHRLFCLIGSGLNGKSCFLNLLKKFIGNSNCCSTELEQLIRDRFEKTRLHKKLICELGETNFGEMSQTSILKKLTGGDLIGFEYKRGDLFDEVNYAKIIIATNNLPTTTDKSIGFYRRWMIIDFPNQFTEKVDIMGSIPEKEYSNLARQSVVTLSTLLKNREFHNEGSIEDRKNRYESKSNFLEAFMDEYVNQDGLRSIVKGQFARRFADYCKANGHREMTANAIGVAMKKLGVESAKETKSWANDGKGGQVRVWRGLDWTDGYEEN